MSRPLRLLIFTPFASRTGSEMMLWYLLKHIDRTRFQIGLVCFRHGELLRDLPADVPVWVAPKTFSFWGKVAHQLGRNPLHSAVRNAHRAFKPDLWYVNTLTLPEVVHVANQLGVPFVTHVHELPLSYGNVSRDELRDVLDRSALLIGCSECASQALREATDHDRIATLHSFIDTSALPARPEQARRLRADLGIVETEFVWLMSGTTSDRKGFDFFPDLARHLNDPRAHLLWLGSRLDTGLTYHTEQRCRDTGPTRVHVVGEKKEDYAAYLQVADGFVLTSRQDPFPLVMIEAAALGKPIVAFQSGGVAEFVQPGMGEVVDSWNLPDLVAAMRRVMNRQTPFDPSVARRRAAEFDVSQQLPRWDALLARFERA
jgi:glycosyltransferase involved in cell wall biosynthesis